MLPSPRSRRSRHRFAQGQVSPALCPCEPGRPRGVKQAVPYSTHSASRFESRSFRSLCPEYNSRLDVYFPAKTALTPPGRVRLSCKQKKQWHTQTISLVLGPAQASAARDGRIHPLCTPAHAPTAKTGAETPQHVSGMARASYRLFDDSVPWWLCVDVCERTRRVVCTRHALYTADQATTG